MARLLWLSLLTLKNQPSPEKFIHTFPWPAAAPPASL